MIHKFLDINTLDEKMTAKYYPLLSEKRRKNIENLPTPRERSIAFCSDIIARRTLSELCDAPEFSFELLLNPNGMSAVGNYDAKISLVLNGDILGCAVSKNSVGMAVAENKTYNFGELQGFLTDSELRDVFSQSVYSYCELLNMPELAEEKLCQRAGVYNALKKAYFKAKGKYINNNLLSVDFSLLNGSVSCSDKNVIISALGADVKNGFVYAVAESVK